MNLNIHNIKKNFYYKNIRQLIIIFYFFTLIATITIKSDLSSIKKSTPYNEIYNKIYYELSINYNYFLKKIYRLDEEFLERLLKKESEDHLNKKILIYKEAYDWRAILHLLKMILKNIKNHSSMLINTLKLEQFIENIEKEIQNNRAIKQAFKKGIYTITGNEKAYHELNSIKLSPITFDPKILNDLSILTLFWVLYSYEKFSNILDTNVMQKNNELRNEELFVYSYPIYTATLNQTFDEIKLNETLFKYFYSLLITSEGLSNFINNEKYNKAMNEEMAFHIIQNQKIKFMELLLDEKNKPLFKKINSLMKKIADISSQLQLLKQGKSSDNHWIFDLFGIKDLSLESYFAQYIPAGFFGWGGGINSHKNLYNINSALLFYDSSFGHIIQRIWRSKNDNDSRSMGQGEEQNGIEKKDVYNSWFHNTFSTIVTPPLFGLWKMSINKENFLKYKSLAIEDRNGNLIPIASKDRIRQAWWDERNVVTIGDYINQYQNNAYLQILPLLGTIAGTFMFTANTIMDLRQKYFSIKSLLSQYKSVKTHYKYFFCLKKIILYSKQLTNTLITLYQQNNIAEEYMLPEIIHMKDAFNNQSEDALLNRILSWSSKKINLYLNNVYNFFVPGSMAHFYFKELYESIEIDVLNNFIGSIDIVLAKLKLLDIKKDYPELVFSIPILLDPSENKNAVFKAKNMWFPCLKGTPIKNSVELEKESRNMMIVSPVAGGKTVLLSTILTQLYLANIGIVPAEKIEYTYFTNIIDHMRHDYDIGSGMSQHLAERRSMHVVKNIAANQMENEKSIIIIDEIYKGTIPQLAVKEAFLDLPPILEKKNIITLITTHFPEITKITENKKLSIQLYYLLVDYVAGMFNKTHKLLKDDEFNWWIRDSELGLKYQLSQDIV